MFATSIKGALVRAITESPGGSGTTIRIRTDSKSCTTTLASLALMTPRQWVRLPCRWVWRLILANITAREAGGQKVEVQWVKAHTGGKDVPSLWNDRADYHAKVAADADPPHEGQVPMAEDRWGLLHERRAVVSDVTRSIGKLHAERATRALDEVKWLPSALDDVDRMAIAHITKPSSGDGLQMRAVRLWAKNGLRTIGKLVARNPDSRLAEEWEAGDMGCPLCGAEGRDSEHILTGC